MALAESQSARIAPQRINSMLSEDRDYKLYYYLARTNNRYDVAKYKQVMSWLPQKPNLRILNAGCGAGEMNLLLCQNQSWQVDALDVDGEAIRLSQQLSSDHNLTNLNLYHTSIEAHHPRASYDIIVSNDVLEHIENDGEAIEYLYKMLKPNGIICLSVPALPWLYGYHDRQLGHYRRYRRQELLEKLSPFFDIDRCRYFGCSLIPIAVFYSLWWQKAYPIGQIGKRSFLIEALDLLLKFESKIPFPLGISLMIFATAKS
jgi:2-polyprenyl-3-methyl-5-hydroxy-6-metoxy-1,4-benzoquinol methylase